MWSTPTPVSRVAQRQSQELFVCNFLVGTICTGYASFCKRLCLELVNNGPKAANSYGGELCSLLHGCGKRPNAYFMMQSFSMTEMQSSSIKVSHHESGVPTASSSGSPPPIDGMQVAQWKKPLATISNGGRVTWPHFVDFLRVHCVTAEACTCATYCTLGFCEGCLLWLLVKEPSFKVPLCYS